MVGHQSFNLTQDRGCVHIIATTYFEENLDYRSSTRSIDSHRKESYEGHQNYQRLINIKHSCSGFTRFNGTKHSPVSNTIV